MCIHIYIYYTISYTINKSRRQSVSNMKAAGSKVLHDRIREPYWILYFGPTRCLDLTCCLAQRVLWILLVRGCTVCFVAQHRLGFAHLAVISMVVSDVFALCATGLLRRFLYPMLNTLAFVPNAFYTQKLSKYGLFQNHGLHTCFGLN